MPSRKKKWTSEIWFQKLGAFINEKNIKERKTLLGLKMLTTFNKDSGRVKKGLGPGGSRGAYSSLYSLLTNRKSSAYKALYEVLGSENGVYAPPMLGNSCLNYTNDSSTGMVSEDKQLSTGFILKDDVSSNKDIKAEDKVSKAGDSIEAAHPEFFTESPDGDAENLYGNHKKKRSMVTTKAKKPQQ